MSDLEHSTGNSQRGSRVLFFVFAVALSYAVFMGLLARIII